MSDAIPARVRALVLTRAAGACEACGAEGVPLELHHRRYRSRGGKHVASNLIALCGRGNHSGCHGWAHSGGPLAADWGVSLHSWDDPLTSRLWSAQAGAWRLLDDEGGQRPAIE